MYQPPHARPGLTFVAPRLVALRAVRSDQIDRTMTAASATRSSTTAAPAISPSASSRSANDFVPSWNPSQTERRFTAAKASNADAPTVHQKSTIVALRSPAVGLTGRATGCAP
jgi:hypothetical protein